MTLARVFKCGCEGKPGNLTATTAAYRSNGDLLVSCVNGFTNVSPYEITVIPSIRSLILGESFDSASQLCSIGSPTASPTFSDLVIVSTTFEMSAEDEADLTEENIFPAVATTLDGVDESDLSNLKVTWTADASPLLRSKRSNDRRRLSGTAVVTFDITKSISETDSADAGSFEEQVASEISEAVTSGALSVEVAQNCGCEAEVTSADAKIDGYAPQSISEAWNNHFEAFGAQDLDQIMLDYTEDSVLESYESTSGVLTNASGLVEIRQFFTDLFAILTDLSELEAPVVQVTEEPVKQVYLIWSCASSGVTFAHDSFYYDDNYRIVRQNIGATIVGPSPTMTPTAISERSKESNSNGKDDDEGAETASIVLGSIFGTLFFIFLVVAGGFYYQNLRSKTNYAGKFADDTALTESHRFTEMTDTSQRSRAHTAAFEEFSPSMTARAGERLSSSNLAAVDSADSMVPNPLNRAKTTGSSGTHV